MIGIPIKREAFFGFLQCGMKGARRGNAENAVTGRGLLRV
jgi:hypothetical protein